MTIYRHMRLIDIHTHCVHPNGSAISIMNVLSGFDQLADEQHFYSAGLHPWYLKDSQAENDFSRLEKLVLHPHVLAIGECGLDKVCDTEMTLQEVWFRKQIMLANTVMKPLIIHCVRAYDEVLAILKSIPVQVPVIFHGYGKSESLARRILGENSNYYLSFGKGLMKEDVAGVFNVLSSDRIFLETDSSSFSIEEFYSKASQIKNVSLEQMTEQIGTTALKVFGKSILTV